MFEAPILVSPFTIKAALGGIGAERRWVPGSGAIAGHRRKRARKLTFSPLSEFFEFCNGPIACRRA